MAIISSLMKTEMVTVKPDDSVADAAKVMAQNHVGAVLVIDAGNTESFVLTLALSILGGQGADQPQLIFAGVASLFGGTVLAIPFVLELVDLPRDLFQVFLSIDVIDSLLDWRQV